MFILNKILKYTGIFSAANISDKEEQKQYSKVVLYTLIWVLTGILLFHIIF